MNEPFRPHSSIFNQNSDFGANEIMGISVFESFLSEEKLLFCAFVFKISMKLLFSDRIELLCHR